VIGYISFYHQALGFIFPVLSIIDFKLLLLLLAISFGAIVIKHSMTTLPLMLVS
jgi:hypothetical protein